MRKWNSSEDSQPLNIIANNALIFFTKVKENYAATGSFTTRYCKVSTVKVLIFETSGQWWIRGGVEGGVRGRGMRWSPKLRVKYD